MGATQGSERPALLSLNHSIAQHHQYTNRVGRTIHSQLPFTSESPSMNNSSLQLTITSKTCNTQESFSLTVHTIHSIPHIQFKPRQPTPKQSTHFAFFAFSRVSLVASSLPSTQKQKLDPDLNRVRDTPLALAESESPSPSSPLAGQEAAAKIHWLGKTHRSSYFCRTFTS